MPEVKIVLFTTFPTSDLIAKALDYGAKGVVFKSAADTELVTAIRTVASGKPYISPSVAKLPASDPPIEPLTPRQSEILESISRGLSNSDIAKEHGITPTTVREYTIALFQKNRRGQPKRSHRNRASQAPPEDLIRAETGSTYGTIAGSLAIPFASRVVVEEWLLSEGACCGGK